MKDILEMPEKEFFIIWKHVPLSIVECVIVSGNKILMTKRKGPP